MENALQRKERRKRLINGFRIFAAVQFVVGFLLLFFGFYCIGFQDTRVVSGTVPYYTGSIISGFTIMFPTIVCVALYYKGTAEEVQKLEKMTAFAIETTIKILLYSSPMVVVLFLLGEVITASYGLCAVKCSYSSQTDMNFGMSAYLVTLEGVALCITLGNTLLCWKTCKYLSIETLCHCNAAPADIDTGSEVKSAEHLNEIATVQS